MEQKKKKGVDKEGNEQQEWKWDSIKDVNEVKDLNCQHDTQAMPYFLFTAVLDFWKNDDGSQFMLNYYIFCKREVPAIAIWF